MMKYRKAMNEVLQIIDLLNEKERNKIPANIIDYFRKNQSINNETTIIPTLPLKKQNISKEGKTLLAFIATYL